MWQLGIGIGIGGPAVRGGGGALLDGSESDGTNILTGGALDFSSDWSALNMTLTANAVQDAAGTTLAATLREDTSTSRHGCYINTTVGSGTKTYSIYAKQVTRRYLQFLLNGTGEIYAYFDLQAGAVTDSGIAVAGGSTAIGTPTIQQGANGFWKCTVPGADSSSTVPFLLWMCSDVGTFGAPLVFDSPSYTGVAANGANLWRPKVV